jgi:hypothetical protein
VTWKLEFAILAHDEKTTERNRIYENIKNGKQHGSSGKQEPDHTVNLGANPLT